MVSDKTVQNAMQIILHAGDARQHCMSALKAIEKNDYGTARAEMKKANTEIVKAHQVQTDAIQQETQGGAGEYSVLFTHAQDTLMTVYSELNIAKRMISIFENFENRLSVLEESSKERNDKNE